VLKEWEGGEGDTAEEWGGEAGELGGCGEGDERGGEEAEGGCGAEGDDGVIVNAALEVGGSEDGGAHVVEGLLDCSEGVGGLTGEEFGFSEFAERKRLG